MITKITNYTILLSLGALVSACSFENPQETLRATMYEPTKITEQKMTIEKSHFVDKKTASDVDYSYLSHLVNAYEHDGDSPVYAVFTYNPEKKNAKLKAFNKSNIVKGQLAKLGAKNTVIKTLPVKDASEDLAIIGYDKLTASGPKSCEANHALRSDSSASLEENYLQGCTIKDMRARQIAYPADLRGQDGMSDYNAKRAGTPVQRDSYSGNISAFVPSYILSDVGSE